MFLSVNNHLFLAFDRIIEQLDKVYKNVPPPKKVGILSAVATPTGSNNHKSP